MGASLDLNLMNIKCVHVCVAEERSVFFSSDLAKILRHFVLGLQPGVIAACHESPLDIVATIN